MDKFSQLEYRRPDIARFKKDVKAQLDRFVRAESYAEAREAYLAGESLQAEIATMYVLASIRNNMDTADAFYDGEMKFFNKAMAGLMPLSKKSTEALLASRFRPDFEKEFGKQMMASAEMDRKVQSRKIILDMVRESNLEDEYKKDAAGCKVDFRGEECNFYGLLRHMESRDRAERIEAYHAWAKLYEDVSPKLDGVYSKLVDVRVKMAGKLGLRDYTEMAYLSRHRADYTREDVAAFRRQIKEVVAPAVGRLAGQQAERLGIDKVKYYDETIVFPEGNADPIGGKDVLVPIASQMYRELSPETGEYFDFMTEHELFDLETRPGKHLGGYCTYLMKYQAPFIFSNFNGTAADIQVLTHEAGHAFQGYLGMRCQPLLEYYSSTSEINEIHSMAMELFTLPWTGKFVGEAGADKARYAHLLQALAMLPYICVVDEYQHRVYEKPDMTPLQRRETWRAIEKDYMPGRDYDGVDFLEKGGFWMQKQHIFLYPFYYIDYALAQVCAFELYGRMKTDPKKAWEDYLRLCRAGGSLGYFELLKTADLTNPFQPGGVQKMAGHVIEELESWKF